MCKTFIIINVHIIQGIDYIAKHVKSSNPNFLYPLRKTFVTHLILCILPLSVGVAASSLTLSTGALSSSVKPQHGTNSLLHCLIKLAQREMERDLSSVAKACMSLLTTLSLCAECRSIMWKVQQSSSSYYLIYFFKMKNYIQSYVE